MSESIRVISFRLRRRKLPQQRSLRSTFASIRLLQCSVNNADPPRDVSRCSSGTAAQHGRGSRQSLFVLCHGLGPVFLNGERAYHECITLFACGLALGIIFGLTAHVLALRC